MKKSTSSPKITSRLNHIPISLMSGIWLAPLVMFWAIIFGPLKPFHYPQVDTAPHGLVFLGFILFSLSPMLLGERYFRISPWEENSWRHERLGVNVFKRFVTNGDYINRIVRRIHPGYRYLNGRTDLANLDMDTRRSEQTHLVGLIFGTFSSAYAGYVGWMGWFTLLLVGNILCNLYPCLVQRYNRSRIYRLTRA